MAGEVICEICGLPSGPGMRFCGRCGSALPNPEARQGAGAPPAGTSPGAASSYRVTREGERRQVTVMFIDLVNASALSERLDPEDLRDLIRAYQSACYDAVSAHGGHVAHYMGDGLLVYFGAPVAHEDDPVQAVRAGLRVVVRVGEVGVAAGTPLEARVGLHTGVTVVGEMGQGASRVPMDVVGATPNLAARLQGAAPSGAVLLSDATARLVRDSFELEPFGALELKGIPAPVTAFRAVAPSRPSEAAAGGPPGPTPLVGRQTELRALSDRCRLAAAARPHFVVLVGEPGIGKTRLAEAVGAALEGEGFVPLALHAVRDHANTPLLPVVDLLRQRVGQPSGADFVAALVADGIPLATAGLVAGLVVGLDVTEPGASPYSPERRRRMVIDALRRWMVARAGRGRLLLTIEDLQWLDPSTSDLVSSLLEAPPPVPVAVLATVRAGEPLPWPAGPHVDHFTVGRLAPEDMRQMVLALSGGLAAEAVDRIVARSDGIPMFAEELARAATEDGAAGQAVPARLYGLLRASLDRLGPEVELARLGSVLGREWPDSLLAAVTSHDSDRVRTGLARLVEAGVLEVRDASEGRYAFRHALIRDAAYESVVRTRRRELHEQVARTLVERFPERARRLPEELAHHWSEAGAVPEAIQAWSQAAQAASEHFAVAEATAGLRRALDLVPRLAEAGQRDERELELLLQLGPLTLRTLGVGHSEVQVIYERALELCECVGPGLHQLFALEGVYAYWSARPDHGRASPIGDTLLELAQREGRRGIALRGLALRGSQAYLAGDRGLARQHLATCLEQYDTARSPRDPYDPGMGALLFMAFVEWDAGHPATARALAEEARAIAQRRAHPFTLAYADLHVAKLHVRRHDVTEASRLAAATAAVATEHGYEQLRAQAQCIEGWAVANNGQPARGTALVDEGLEAMRRAGSMADASLHLLCLTEARTLDRDQRGALDAARAALEFIEDSGERAVEADVRLRTGELLLGGDAAQTTDGIAELWHAHDVARQQGSCFARLRTSLALFRHDPSPRSAEALAGAIDGLEVQRAGDRHAVPGATPAEEAELDSARQALTNGHTTFSVASE